MYRLIIILLVMFALAAYLRYQYRSVIRKAVHPAPHPQITDRQIPRRQCIRCGGTGRAAPLTLNKSPSNAVTCRSCSGTGSIQTPAFAR